METPFLDPPPLRVTVIVPPLFHRARARKLLDFLPISGQIDRSDRGLGLGHGGLGPLR